MQRGAVVMVVVGHMVMVVVAGMVDGICTSSRCHCLVVLLVGL